MFKSIFSLTILLVCVMTFVTQTCLVCLFGLFCLFRLANGCQRGELQNRNCKNKTFYIPKFHLYYLLKNV